MCTMNRIGEATMAWQRLDESKLKNVGGNFAKLKRAYGKDGNPFPRIVISLYEDSFDKNDVKLSISCKRKAGNWWEDCSLPLDLVDELHSLLQEYKEFYTCHICGAKFGEKCDAGLHG